MGTDQNGSETPTPVLTEVVAAGDEPAVPVLRDAVRTDAAATAEAQLAAVQAELTALAGDLTERLLHVALREMEAALFQQVSDRLREELPIIVEKVLRDHLESGH